MAQQHSGRGGAATASRKTTSAARSTSATKRAGASGRAGATKRAGASGRTPAKRTVGAARSSGKSAATAGRGRSRNDTPGTPGVSETAIGEMRVGDLRDQLRRRGVTGISGLRKDDLVSALTKAMRAERRRGATGPSRKGPVRETGRTDVRPAGKTPSGGQRARGGQQRAGATRTPSGSASRKSQIISGPQDRPERAGRSLVTTSHEVIRRWARSRGGKPCTIGGTERDGRAGVLTFNFPGYRESPRLRQITWDEWFSVFDARRLNFIYQEQLRSGKPSNFFRVESPDREDA